MPEEARYLQNGLILFFPRQTQVRQRAFQLEKALADHYLTPQVLPVADEVDPQVARLVFSSKHGFSQLIISQINAVLNVNYSPDWQTDVAKGKDYLKERSELLFTVLKELSLYPVSPVMYGFHTMCQLSIDLEDRELVSQLSNAYLKDDQGHHDLLIKITDLIDGKYFSNITIENYRSYGVVMIGNDVPRLSLAQVTGRGVQILGDFNDRYAYNEIANHHVKPEDVNAAIDKGLEAVAKTVEKIRGQFP